MAPSDTHYHQLDQPTRRVRVIRDGRVLADSSQTVLLKEVGRGVHDPVFYFPPEDVEQASLEPSPTRTTCPIKGEASYWSLHETHGLVDDVAWTYAEPIEYSQPIAGRIAFDPRNVTLELWPTEPTDD